MFATSEGTLRYAERFAAFRDAGFYRTVLGLEVSSLGIGTYLGNDDDDADAAYTDALTAAGEGGINFFDAAINYRRQRSERCIGAALKRLQRDEVVVCTKAGFITQGAVPETLRREDVAGGMHSMAPEFLADQIDRSRANMDIDTIDVFYLHNPETQLSFLTRAAFDERIRRAFGQLERLADAGKIRCYGAATWDGLRKKGALSLDRLAQIAAEEGGPEHRFRFIQLPFNLNMVEAYVERPESVLESAARLRIAAVASATLMQAEVLAHASAQDAIQFTRSTPGISVALVGMSKREHVLENLGVASTPPIPREQYVGLYQ